MAALAQLVSAERVSSTFSEGCLCLEPLSGEEFSRIAQLNAQYSDLPADFSDLALIAISERFGIAAITTLDFSSLDVLNRSPDLRFVRFVSIPGEIHTFAPCLTYFCTVPN